MVVLTVYLFSPRRFKIYWLIVIFGLVGFYRTQTVLNQLRKNPSVLENYSSRGVIIRSPEKRDYYQKIILAVFGSDHRHRWKVMIKTDPYAPLSYGDQISFQCHPQKPRNLSSDFDYVMFLAKEKIYYSCSDYHLKVLTHHQGNPYYDYLLRIKNRLEKTVNRVIPQPEAALANGLLLGGSGRLTDEWKDKFAQTGMSHIVAVSGFNVTSIANYLMILGIAAGFSRKRSFWLALAGIVLFVLLIGWPASAVRAGLMSGFLLWAIKNGRLGNAVNAILSAAFLMLLFNPLLLRWDIGFQLSFLAALGLVLWAPFWEKHFVKKFRAFGLSEIFFLTLSAQIFVWPIIFINFHNLSLVSFVANLLVLGVLPLTMSLVFFTALGSLIFLPLGWVISWLAYLFLFYILAVINFLSQAGGHFQIYYWPWWFSVIWYGLLLGIYKIVMSGNIKNVFTFSKKRR